MTFNGFISYSHAADNRLAPAVQRGLHRLAKPWHRRRALWIFRDQTGLAVTPALWSSIQKALDGSDYFVLLASPEAACSPWVNREIEHWVATKSAEKILPVVTDGQWRWDPVRQDFSVDSTAVPAALRGVFAEEPLYLDLRWARDDRHLSLRHSRFRDAIAQLAAPMHGVSKDDLEGEDVRQHRRARQLRSGALTTLVVLLLVASLTGVLAVRNAGRANTAAAEALRQQHTAMQERGHAERSAEEARRQQGLAEQQQARAVNAAAETQRQVRLAREQRALAEQASVEAGRQEKLARDQKALAAQASVEAGRQEKLARDQKAAATRSSAEAERQQSSARRMRDLADQARTRAQEQQRLAQQQRALAQRWAAQARLQEQNARRHEQEAKEQERRAKEQERNAREQERKARDAAQEADRQQRNAEQQRTIAVGRRLVNQAKATIEEDPRTALMLATAADTVQADTEAHRELTGLVTSTRYAGVLADMDSIAFGAGDIVAAHHDFYNTVSLWNVADRAHPVELAILDGVGWSSRLEFSPDGRTLAVIRTPAYRDEGALVLWNVANPRRPVQAAELPDLTRVSELAFAPDGRTLAVYSEKFNPPPTNPPWVMTMTLWDVTDAAHPEMVSRVVKTEPVDEMRFSADGRTMVTTFEDMQIWDVADRARPVLLDTREHGLDRPVAFSPADPVLATVVPDRPRTVVLWDMHDPAQPRKASELTVDDAVESMAFHPDGHTLAVGDAVGAVTLWDVTDPSGPVKRGGIGGNDRTVRGLVFSRDGRTLATCGVEAVTLWNTADYGAPTVVAAIGGEHGRALATAFAPDGRSMMTVHPDGTAGYVDVSRPEAPVRATTPTLHPREVYAAAFSADRRTVATTGADDQVRLTDVTDPRRPETLATIPVEIRSWRPREILDLVTFSPDGRMLAVATSEGRVLLWDVTELARPRPLTTVDRLTAVESIRFSPDGHTMALAGGYGGVDFWDMTNPSRPVQRGGLMTRRLGSPSGMPAIFGPDGNLLVAQGSSEKTAALWDVTDRTHPHRLAGLAGHAAAIVSATLSPDGKTLLTGSADGTVIGWDISDPGKPLRIATLHTGTARGASTVFSPDGHTLASTGTSSFNGAVTLWNYAALTGLRADSARQSCAMTGRGLTEDEWSRFIPEIPYRRTCP